jgi:hypothetical protein
LNEKILASQEIKKAGMAVSRIRLQINNLNILLLSLIKEALFLLQTSGANVIQLLFIGGRKISDLLSLSSITCREMKM